MWKECLHMICQKLELFDAGGWCYYCAVTINPEVSMNSLLVFYLTFSYSLISFRVCCCCLYWFQFKLSFIIMANVFMNFQKYDCLPSGFQDSLAIFHFRLFCYIVPHLVFFCSEYDRSYLLYSQQLSSIKTWNI